MIVRVCSIFLCIALGASCVAAAPESVLVRAQRYVESRALPAPTLDGSPSLAQTLTERRSTREFGSESLSTETVGQLFWATQGITDQRGHRTAPSAGARYPLEVYAVSVTELMHYLPDGHRIEVGDARNALSELGPAAFGQDWVASAPLVFVITGTVARTEAEYGAVAEDLMNREAGHAAQNFLLQATALDLAAVPVGGFDPALVGRLLALAPGEEVLYLLPVGRRP